MAMSSTIYGTESVMLGFVNKAKGEKEPVQFLSPFCFYKWKRDGLFQALHTVLDVVLTHAVEVHWLFPIAIWS